MPLASDLHLPSYSHHSLARYTDHEQWVYPLCGLFPPWTASDAVSSPEPTLLEQLSLLSNPVPTELDPEAAYTSLSASRSGGRQRGGSNASDDDDGGEGGAAAREHYVEVG